MTRFGASILTLMCAALAALVPTPAAAQSQYVRTLEDRDHVTVRGVQLDGGFSIGGRADSRGWQPTFSSAK